ncbi:hypothetical protein NM75_20030 [Dickeya fangzhongdai]|nr:hypothetical protein LH89_04030 [Dickeya fangzhongdai]KGT96471.1 hypothetical protein NM75_20030 [Dickeya fangzhongdai]
MFPGRCRFNKAGIAIISFRVKIDSALRVMVAPARIRSRFALAARFGSIVIDIALFNVGWIRGGAASTAAVNKQAG